MGPTHDIFPWKWLDSPVPCFYMQGGARQSSEAFGS